MVRIGTRYQVPLGPKKRLTGLSKQVAQAAPRAMRNTYIPLAKSLDPPNTFAGCGKSRRDAPRALFLPGCGELSLGLREVQCSLSASFVAGAVEGVRGELGGFWRLELILLLSYSRNPRTITPNAQYPLQDVGLGAEGILIARNRIPNRWCLNQESLMWWTLIHRKPEKPPTFLQ